jgi:hypothetical protein
MPQIYEKSSLVLLWLGPEGKGSNLALDTVSAGAAQDFNPQWITGLYESHGRESLFDAIMELLIREYWNRLWIVQEIAYAREVKILCGLKQIPYASLVKFLEVLKRHNIDATMANSNIGRIVRLYLGAIGPVGLKEPGSARAADHFEDPAWMLARNATTKKCMDPRDRIYGCRGLFSPELREMIPVDYSKGPDEIIMGATTSIIETTRRLDVIVLKRRSETGPELELWKKTLPSWVPELDDKFGQREIFFDALNPKYRVSASGSKEARCIFMNGGRVLNATGVQLGCITKIQDRNYRPSDHMYGKEHEHIDLIKYIFEFRTYLGDMVHSRQELIAFWSTILGNFLQFHVVLETPQGQDPGTEVFRAAEITEQTVVNFAIEMQHMHQSVEDRRGVAGFLQSVLGTPVLTKHQTAFIEPIYRHLDHRSFFKFQRTFPSTNTSSRSIEGEILRDLDIGVGPGSAREGDILCVLYGCKVPVILRPKGRYFQVVGDAYIHNFMNGEAVARVEDGSAGLEEFYLE